MEPLKVEKKIAILGGGPSGLFLYKNFVESGCSNISIDIYEAKNYLGHGMPYSTDGANTEHITNVSGNEIPTFEISLVEWISSLPPEKLLEYDLEPGKVTDYMVVPRLLFGEYLSDQFKRLQKKASIAGLKTSVHLNSRVTDVIDVPGDNKVIVEIEGKEKTAFDKVIICTGHTWPLTYEGRIHGYYDSPYPPSKLELNSPHTIAIRGSSLTAIDAIRTLARHNGTFVQEAPHQLSFVANENANGFKIVMHSRQGLLPGIRFHLDDPHLSKNSLLTQADIYQHMQENNGFLSLDFIFEQDFKNSLREKDPKFYEKIQDMGIEEFVDVMMSMRERIDPFQLFKIEYVEAKKSIQRRESVYWKEMLAILSFAMNYPAKHFSAEDMQRLQKVLMPLIAIVIAFVPQSSCEELIALHEAGRLDLVSVGEDNHVEICSEGGIIYHHTDELGTHKKNRYSTYIDCIGQKHLSMEDFPFQSLVEQGAVSPARLKFKSPAKAITQYISDHKEIEKVNDKEYFLKVPGIAITDTFRSVQMDGKENSRIYVMAVSYIGGYNPDYSGLDFCEEASAIIAKDIFKNN